jgi:hypothetical protein
LSMIVPLLYMKTGEPDEPGKEAISTKVVATPFTSKSTAGCEAVILRLMMGKLLAASEADWITSLIDHWLSSLELEPPENGLLGVYEDDPVDDLAPHGRGFGPSKRSGNWSMKRSRVFFHPFDALPFADMCSRRSPNSVGWRSQGHRQTAAALRTAIYFARLHLLAHQRVGLDIDELPWPEHRRNLNER